MRDTDNYQVFSKTVTHQFEISIAFKLENVQAAES